MIPLLLVPLVLPSMSSTVRSDRAVYPTVRKGPPKSGPQTAKAFILITNNFNLISCPPDHPFFLSLAFPNENADSVCSKSHLVKYKAMARVSTTFSSGGVAAAASAALLLLLLALPQGSRAQPGGGGGGSGDGDGGPPGSTSSATVECASDGTDAHYEEFLA